ncbi:MAG: extradiol ring-cleavage dioxygenase [Actinobacteria bacterium]|jgi:aromatic ring-opening dioxygenase LigB subunit|nr:extradiol ring-cleavage dioxygenase [Actinomycetota bacterium]
MTLIGCFVTPHPAIIVPEVGGDRLAEVEDTVQAMRSVQAKTAALAPETIVLLSPHAPILAGQMSISMALSYRGSLASFGAADVTVKADGDRDLAEAIMSRAADHGVRSAITASRGDVIGLDHGSVVPLVYLMGSLKQPCRLVLLAFSQMDREDHVLFGRAVGEAVLETPRRVLYVASGDLSHRLMPGAPVGYDPRGARFDRAVVDAFGAADWDALLRIDPGLTAAAGECGYRSLAVLAGVMTAAKAAGLTTKNTVLSYEGPFGVGYLVGEVEVSAPTSEQGGSV